MKTMLNNDKMIKWFKMETTFQTLDVFWRTRRDMYSLRLYYNMYVCVFIISLISIIIVIKYEIVNIYKYIILYIPHYTRKIQNKTNDTY